MMGRVRFTRFATACSRSCHASMPRQAQVGQKAEACRRSDRRALKRGQRKGGNMTLLARCDNMAPQSREPTNAGHSRTFHGSVDSPERQQTLYCLAKLSQTGSRKVVTDGTPFRFCFFGPLRPTSMGLPAKQRCDKRRFLCASLFDGRDRTPRRIAGACLTPWWQQAI